MLLEYTQASWQSQIDQLSLLHHDACAACLSERLSEYLSGCHLEGAQVATALKPDAAQEAVKLGKGCLSCHYCNEAKGLWCDHHTPLQQQHLINHLFYKLLYRLDNRAAHAK